MYNFKRNRNDNNTMEMLERLNIVIVIKNTFNRYSSIDFTQPRKESVNLKIGQQKLPKQKQEGIKG